MGGLTIQTSPGLSSVLGPRGSPSRHALDLANFHCVPSVASMIVLSVLGRDKLDEGCWGLGAKEAVCSMDTEAYQGRRPGERVDVEQECSRQRNGMCRGPEAGKMCPCSWSRWRVSCEVKVRRGRLGHGEGDQERPVSVVGG